MSEWRTWREAATTKASLRDWRRAGAFDTAGMRRAQTALASADPSPREWRWFLDRFGLSLGVALCAAGTICFIAANWEHLGKFTRLYGFQALLLIAVAAVAKLGVARKSGQAALWLATMVLGGLLALIGQTYQTGADTWELFALWTALALPWTFAARNAVQWLTWGALLNVAVGLWLGLHPQNVWFGGATASMWLGVLNLSCLFVWETAARRWPDVFTDIGRRVGRWLLAAMTLWMSTFASIDERLNDYRDTFGATAVWAVAAALLLWRYGRRQRDLPVLAMLALSIIAIAISALVDLLFDGPESASDFLIVALAMIAFATVAVVALRRLAREEAR